MLNRQLFIALSVLFACVGANTAAHAQEGKIGYVNMSEVVEGYHKTKAYDAEFKQKYEQKQKEIESKTAALKQLESSMELLSDDAREQKIRELQAKADEVKRLTNYANRDLQVEKRKLLSDVLKDVDAAVKAYGEAKGFTLLVDDAAILYASSGMEVTEDIISQLNAGR